MEIVKNFKMKKLLGIVVLGLLLSSNAYAVKIVSITIKELVDKGYKLTHTDNRDGYGVLYFENGSDIYSCTGKDSTGYTCAHLTDGR